MSIIHLISQDNYSNFPDESTVYDAGAAEGSVVVKRNDGSNSRSSSTGEKQRSIEIPWHLCFYLLCLPPSVTGEVYCNPRYQLILSFDRRVIYYLKGLWEYIPQSILSVCLSVPRSSNE